MARELDHPGGALLFRDHDPNSGRVLHVELVED